MKTIKITFLVFLFSFANNSQARLNPKVPNASMEVTIQEKSNGKLDKRYVLLKLDCWQGNCSFTRLMLNRCLEGEGGKKVFYPAIERFSTEEGDLEVIPEKYSLTAKLSDAETKTIMKFGYQNKRSKVINQVTSFSGGYIKDSIVLKKVIHVEYIPLRGDFSYVDLDCAVMLPGVPDR